MRNPWGDTAGVAAPRPPVPARLDGLLLSGGRSRRFGSDKRRARLEDRTLAEHALALLRRTVDGDVFVAGADAFDRPVQAIAVADADLGAGPLAGIVGALLRSRRGVVVLPCDAPLVRAGTLAAVGSLARKAGRPVVVRSRRGLEPLVAFYPRSALPFLCAQLRGGQRALHRLLPRLGALEVEVTDAREMHNVNRPADLAALAARRR